MLGLEAHRHWPALLATINSDELLVDKFKTTQLRLQNNVELIALLDAFFATKPLSEWTALFDEHDVWWAPVNSIVDVILDPQARAAGGFVSMSPRDGEEPFEAVNSPVDFEDYEIRPGPVPYLGEHTEALLKG